MRDRFTLGSLELDQAVPNHLQKAGTGELRGRFSLHTWVGVEALSWGPPAWGPPACTVMPARGL